MMFFDTSGLNDGELCLQLIRTTEAQPEKGYVPAYHFHIRRCCDQVVLGECALRVGHNQNTYYGGNIGYGIYEPYRGHHYAGKACLLLLDLAKRHSMDHLIIAIS